MPACGAEKMPVWRVRAFIVDDTRILRRNTDICSFPNTHSNGTKRDLVTVAADRRERRMLKNFDDLQKFGKDNVDVALKQLGAVSKGFQAIAAEFADYSKKSFEQSTAATEKLLGSRTFEKAVEIQSDYVKTAYEGFVAEATKLGELYADLAKETYKPFEGYVAKVSPAK
jgi:hypothetical protein